MKITKQQLSVLVSALTLGDYFVEISEPAGEQYQSDKETMTKAREILKQIEATK
jgi:hypothetical protein